MDERIKFLVEANLRRERSFAATCRLFGISRKTGYKWLARYAEEGALGLLERTSAPHSSPQRISPPIADALVRLRRIHPSWGARKLVAHLAVRQPDVDWPAASTVTDLLNRRGLVVPRKRRRRAEPSSRPFKDCKAPNDTWCIDFKGQFRVGSGLCYPLTVSDAHSRYVLCCAGMPRIDGAEVRHRLERLFREHGLPIAMRSDNGPPFASTGAGGLTRLSAWWVRLGIALERIEPGKPQQNGRHERMHGALKVAVERRTTLAAQQRALDSFRRTYNEDRPHEALAMTTPAEHYASSPRQYPRLLPELEYPTDYELRRVRSGGDIKWRYHHVFLNSALAGETVGLRPEDEGIWGIYFGSVLLGHTDDGGRALVRPCWGRKRVT